MQALPSWLNQFGDTVGPDGLPTLTTYARSICNSVNFVGLLAGCLTFEVVVERTGYKLLLFLISILQCVAVIGEFTSLNRDLEERCPDNQSNVPPSMPSH
jgi:hypothetical protein